MCRRQRFVRLRLSKWTTFWPRLADRTGRTMSEFKDADGLLDALGKVLLRCFVLGYLLLLLWFGAYLLAGDLLYRINGPLFGLSQHEMNLMHLYGIVFVKCCVILFFLFPYVAIRLVLRKAKS